MRWSERQLAMLREMGIRVWSREAAAVDSAQETSAILVAERAVEAAPAVLARAPATAYAALAGAEWLVVGEPFETPAGGPDAAAEQEQLLDNMLHAIRVSRRAADRAGRACHLPVEEGRAGGLEAAIDQVRPRCILALGRAAAATLLGVDEPLGKLRERVHRRGDVPVVVTFALPYLLRHSADKARAWADLCRAVAAIG
jgi:uracil-DNA glycosylase